MVTSTEDPTPRPSPTRGDADEGDGRQASRRAVERYAGSRGLNITRCFSTPLAQIRNLQRRSLRRAVTQVYVWVIGARLAVPKTVEEVVRSPDHDLIFRREASGDQLAADEERVGPGEVDVDQSIPPLASQLAHRPQGGAKECAARPGPVWRVRLDHLLPPLQLRIELDHHHRRFQVCLPAPDPIVVAVDVDRENVDLGWDPKTMEEVRGQVVAVDQHPDHPHRWHMHILARQLCVLFFICLEYHAAPAKHVCQHEAVGLVAAGANLDERTPMNAKPAQNLLQHAVLSVL